MTLRKVSEIDLVQDELMGLIRDNFVQRIVEAALPDEETLLRDDRGRFDPYIAVQFGDLYQVGSKNMATSSGHNYVMPFFIGVTTPDAIATRRLMNKMNTVLLGFSSEYGGEVYKRPSGQTYIIPAQQGAIEAYVAPVSFAIPVEPRFVMVE